MRMPVCKPRSRRAAMHLFGASLLLTASGATFSAPTFTALPLLDGFPILKASDLSADGTAAAGTALGVGLDPRAVRWTVAGGSQNLGVPPNRVSSHGAGISPDGATVVGHGRLSRSTGAFRWTTTTGIVPLPAPAGFANAMALDASLDGTRVVGHAVTFGGANGAIPTPYASYWDAAGDAHPLSPATVSSCVDVSDDGSVMVGYATISSGNTNVFRWNADGVAEDLGRPENAASAQAWAVSGDGRVIGGSFYGGTGDFRDHAFRWSSATGFVDLGFFANDAGTAVNAMSGDGAVMVGVSFEGFQGASRAVAWVGNSGPVDLNTHLPSLGVDLTGWSLTEATGVSADGGTILGNGVFGGNPRAWIVTNVPEPSAVGVLVIAAWPRRRR